MEKFDSLASLDPGRYNWKVKVRISRQWKSIQKSTGEVKGINMILVDNKNTRKHAFVGEACIQKFMDCFEEGDIYIIENFNIKAYSEKEKHHCFKDETHIFFSSYTEQKKFVRVDNLIPQNVFGFYDISELNEVSQQNKFLIDVIGYVHKVEDPRHFVNRNNEEQSYVKFDLSDGRNIVKVTLWDAFGQTFYEEFKKVLDEPKILILSSCKVNIWEKILSLSNYPATRFFFNYNHHSVKALRLRYNDPAFQASQNMINKVVPDPKKTIAELKETIPELDTMGVVCQVTIKKITNTEDWYFHICCGCSKELEKVDGKFFCDKCKKIEPYPDMRFRVCTLASDETGAVGILLYDREVRRVIGKSVFEIYEQQLKDGTTNKFPEILYSLEDISCLITLTLQKAQCLKRSNIFHADDIMLGCNTECSSPSMEHNTYIQQQQSITEGTIVQTNKKKSRLTPGTVNSSNSNKAKKVFNKKISKVNLDDDNDETIPIGMWSTQQDED